MKKIGLIVAMLFSVSAWAGVWESDMSTSSSNKEVVKEDVNKDLKEINSEIKISEENVKDVDLIPIP